MRRALLSIAAASLLAACGGGDGKEGTGAEELLDRAFRQEVESADLRLDAEIQIEGNEALERPVRIQATGPFRASEGRLPSVNLDVRVGMDGGGQTVETGFLSTGDRAFVEFQDVYYEQPAADVRRTLRTLRRGRGRDGSLAALGLEPRSWLEEARVEGEEMVAGVRARHVSGALDVESLLGDLARFVRRSSAALGGAAGRAAAEPLRPEELERVAEFVRSATFDVYVGRPHGIVRRISARIELAVPEGTRTSPGVPEGGSIAFSVELRDVNGDQRIEAPASPRPLSELTRLLGGAAAIGALTGEANAPRSAVPPADPGAGGATAPDAEDFRRYGECLDEARPEDVEALQRCSEHLTGSAP